MRQYAETPPGMFDVHLNWLKRLLLVSALLTGASACSGKGPSKQADQQAPAEQKQSAQAPPAEATQDTLPESQRLAPTRWTGDLDGMIKRRAIRVLVPYSKTQYFIDQGLQRGLAYDFGKKFEDELNTKLKTGNLRVHVVFIPMSRDELLPSLIEGRGDVVSAALTITPERQKQVDFTTPSINDVNEIVVTGPGAPAIASLDDLAGQQVFVRKSSAYYESLLKLNEQLRSQGKKEVVLKPAPETLEDEDLLEMVNSGLVKIIVVDNYLASFWKQIFSDLTLHEQVALRTRASIAPAIRKDSPKLKAELDAFVKKSGSGTAFGNITFQRYLQSTKFAKNATASEDMKRFRAVVELFRKYGQKYEMDWLLMAAQGYQESRLDHSVKSPVGAIGVMQVMPATGKELKVGDIQQLEANIHAGVKYIRFMIDQYFKDEPMDKLNKGLFAFASYNAGPARVRQLREEAKKRGLNPNIWFNNVEQVASERIGRETVTYVSNIYKYYIAYRLAVDEMAERRKAKQAVSPG
jgi:membrane-bound lytic murein transglycosylase MltF